MTEYGDLTFAELESLYPSLLSNPSLNLHNCSLESELNHAAQGTGLAFIVMADVFTALPGAPLWSALFFAMLLSLGFGSQIGILEGVMGTLFDIPQLKHFRKQTLSGKILAIFHMHFHLLYVTDNYFLGIACVICCSIGLIFTTGSGEYWLSFFDRYGAFGLTIIAFSEIMAVVYVYGHERFSQDVFKMTGVKPGFYWQVTWRFAAPLVLSSVVLATLVSQFLTHPNYSIWNQEKVFQTKCVLYSI